MFAGSALTFHKDVMCIVVYAQHCAFLYFDSGVLQSEAVGTALVYGQLVQVLCHLEDARSLNVNSKKSTL
jgi:hypothetical protein